MNFTEEQIETIKTVLEHQYNVMTKAFEEIENLLGSITPEH